MCELVHIKDEWILLRRYLVKPNKNHYINRHFNPDVFYDSDGEPDPECSAFAEKLMAHPDEWRDTNRGGLGLLALLTQEIRNAGADAHHAPCVEGMVVPYSHSHIIHLTRAKCTRLADNCSRRDVVPTPYRH